MDDVFVAEAAQHMRDRVDLTDMAKKLVAEALALRRAAHEARDVDELQLGMDDLRRLAEPGADFEPFVGHGHSADVGLDRAERIVRCLGRLSRR